MCSRPPQIKKYEQAETISESCFIKDSQRRPWPKTVTALRFLGRPPHPTPRKTVESTEPKYSALILLRPSRPSGQGRLMPWRGKADCRPHPLQTSESRHPQEERQNLEPHRYFWRPGEGVTWGRDPHHSSIGIGASVIYRSSKGPQPLCQNPQAEPEHRGGGGPAVHLAEILASFPWPKTEAIILGQRFDVKL